MQPNLKLLGRKTSYNVQKVAWVIAEMGLECEQVELGGAFGGLEKPEYIRLNPNKKVPTLIDGGQALWESNTICRYLVEKYGADSMLSGGSAVDRARGDMWMEWFQNNVYANSIATFHHSVKLPPSQRSAEKRAAAVQGLNETLAIFDAALAGRKFILGDALSLGDIPTGAFLYRYYTMDIERPPLVHLDRYYEGLKARPTYQDAVMVDYRSLIGVD